MIPSLATIKEKSSNYAKRRVKEAAHSDESNTDNESNNDEDSNSNGSSDDDMMQMMAMIVRGFKEDEVQKTEEERKFHKEIFKI